MSSIHAINRSPYARPVFRDIFKRVSELKDSAKTIQAEARTGGFVLTVADPDNAFSPGTPSTAANPDTTSFHIIKSYYPERYAFTGTFVNVRI